MKIAYVSNYLQGYHSHAGGAEKAIMQTAELAKAKGHDVFFITLPFDKMGRAKSGWKVYPVRTYESLVPVFSKYLEVLKWYVKQFDLLGYVAASRIFDIERPDVVHFGNFQFLTFGVVLAAKAHKIPVFLSVYDYWCFCPLTSLFDSSGNTCRRYHGARCLPCLPKTLRPVQWMLLVFRKRIFDRMLSWIDKFIVLSESSRDILSGYGLAQSKISVIRLPFEREDNRQDSAPVAGRYVLFMGWLQRRKGLHILLDAMKGVWKKHPGVKLVAVSQKAKWEEEYEKLIRAKLKDIPADKINMMTGQKQGSEISALIKHAEVVAVPEQWENMSPLIVIESMYFEKPVVASRLGGIPELIEHGKEGLLFSNGDSAGLAENVNSLLEDAGKARLLGKNARAKALGLFDPARIAGELDKEYSKWKKR
jgi:glycosyltransferase involved in cell wall biosynthesis